MVAADHTTNTVQERHMRAQAIARVNSTQVTEADKSMLVDVGGDQANLIEVR